jgi:hypothetical protein
MSTTRRTVMRCSSTSGADGSRIATWRCAAPVALEISDPADPFRYLSLRGRVVGVVEEGARAPLEALSQRYLAKPCPWWEPGEVREIFRIAFDRVRAAEIG